MSRLLLFAATTSVAVLGLGACASSGSPVRVDKAEAGVGSCGSFDWLPSTKEATSLTDQRVRSAALAQLESKGYTISPEKPDCRITYSLSSDERPEAKPRVAVGVGRGSGGVGGGIGVSLPVGKRDGRGGTLTLDVVDVAKNAQTWSGSLDATFAAEELTEDEAGKLVADILREYPDKEKR